VVVARLVGLERKQAPVVHCQPWQWQVVAAGCPLVCTLGGDGSVAPLQFKLWDGRGSSGCLTFTPFTTTTGEGSARPLLLVTDAGHDAVHLVDVVARTHVGYVARPGSIAGPWGVAASVTSPLVAVSAWKQIYSCDHVVVVYKRTTCSSGAVWEAVRVIGGGFGGTGPSDGRLTWPHGLRFSGDGLVLCVADYGNASVFRVVDGGLVRRLATGLSQPWDVEEVEGGWLVACFGSGDTRHHRHGGHVACPGCLDVCRGPGRPAWTAARTSAVRTRPSGEAPGCAVCSEHSSPSPCQSLTV
jgi:hypothetical protein